MPRKFSLMLATAGVTAAALLAVSTDASAVGGSGNRVTHGLRRMQPPSAATNQRAGGLMEVWGYPARGSRSAHERLRVAVFHLRRGSYRLFIDDPSTAGTVDMTDVGGITTNRGGFGRIGFDTANGGSLPFSSTLANLAGLTVEVQDGSQNVLLTGTFPTAR